MKIKAIILLLIFFVGCTALNSDEKKVIYTWGFDIEVPASWKYKKLRGNDSFVGRIKSSGVDLYFDWSEMGYANPLVPTMTEYINEEWEWMPTPPYLKEGIFYTTGDVIGERDNIMKKRGVTDTSLVKVERHQIPKRETLIENGKYKVILTYKDTSQIVHVAIPENVSKHDFQVDTLGEYYRKIIRPKNGVEGMTGVYFQDLNSDFNFNLVGENLSIENQQKAIEAFKSIKIKRSE